MWVFCVYALLVLCHWSCTALICEHYVSTHCYFTDIFGLCSIVVCLPSPYFYLCVKYTNPFYGPKYCLNVVCFGIIYCMYVCIVCRYNFYAHLLNAGEMFLDVPQLPHSCWTGSELLWVELLLARKWCASPESCYRNFCMYKHVYEMCLCICYNSLPNAGEMKCNLEVPLGSNTQRRQDREIWPWLLWTKSLQAITGRFILNLFCM